MSDTKAKQMSEKERLDKLYELKRMIKYNILGEHDTEYREVCEHQLRIVEEEIEISLRKLGYRAPNGR